MKYFYTILTILLCSQLAFAKKSVAPQSTKEPIEEADTLLIGNEEFTITEDSLQSHDIKPEEEYEEVIYKPKTSTLHIPININVSLLERKLNENFSGLLYEDADITDDSLMISAWKERDFKLAYDKNILNYKIPIKIWIKKRFGLGFTHTDQEIEATIDLDMKTVINFSKDWGLITKTEILGYNWIKKPVLKLGIIEIPITPFVDKIINGNKTLINETIDNTVKEYVPIQNYIQDIWTGVQDPIDISASGFKAWIKLTPEKLYCTPITGSQGHITTTIGIKSLIEVYMDNPPKVKEKVTKMPQLQMFSSTDEQVKVNLLADVPYSTIDSMGNAIMAGEVFGEGRRSITVEKMQIYGQNEKMMIGVTVKGFINGTIYLEGVPYFEKSTTSIRIKEVDYKLQTKNVFAKIVNLFYKKGLKRIIEEKLIISLKDEFALVKEMSRTELFNKQLVDDVYLNGMLNTLDVEDLFLTPKGLKVGIVFSGKMSIRIE